MWKKKRYYELGILAKSNSLKLKDFEDVLVSYKHTAFHKT